MNMLIGLAGLPRSGKDSVADLLCHNYGFRKYSFADYLKFVAGEYFGYPYSELWSNKTKESRAFLQHLGDFIRSTDDSLLIKKVVSKIYMDYTQHKKMTNGTPFRAVISDVRSPVEAGICLPGSVAFVNAANMSNGGVSVYSIFEKSVIVLVNRKVEDVIGLEDNMKEALEHPIEKFPTACTTWDYMIDNNGSLNALSGQVDGLMNFIRE